VLLAIMVVLLHFGGVSYIGEYAVFGFFALSGYLMTFIMRRNYGYTIRGVGAYGLNRFLRIYPMYWLACLIAIAVLLLLDPQYTTKFNPNYFLPETTLDWAKNIALTLRATTSKSLISPAWALTIELFYYICIGVGVSRSRKLTIIWFVASVIYTMYMVATGMSWPQRYYSLLAASLPFSIGALIFHWQDELREKLGYLVSMPLAPGLMFALILINWAIGTSLGTQTTWSFYLNLILCSSMILILGHRTELPFISRKLDNWFGDLSYPIYLVHYPLGFLLLYLWQQIGFDLTGPGYLMVFLSLPPVILVAWLMAIFIERRIEHLRSAIKNAL
jgi:peptidoglycan/LPS O-acetylase OafA/YrhL